MRYLEISVWKAPLACNMSPGRRHRKTEGGLRSMARVWNKQLQDLEHDPSAGLVVENAFEGRFY